MEFENPFESLYSVLPPISFHGDSKTEFQTQYWIPKIQETTSKAEDLIQEMLAMISNFHDNEDKLQGKQKLRNSSIGDDEHILSVQTRREQIFGEVNDSDITTTRVDVVLKSDNTKYCILSVLKRHFLFSQLNENELEDVIDSMQNYVAAEGDRIIKEGESGDVFYILEKGLCDISIHGEVIQRLEDGSSFGDLALMYNCPRKATVTAVSDCILWTLDRMFFRRVMVTSSSNQTTQLAQFLLKISLFENLSEQTLNQVARSLSKQTYQSGEYIIRQGEIGDRLYVIGRGTVRVTVTSENSDQETVLNRLSEGEIFGERALIRKEPRKANCIAETICECYFLNSQDFALMLGEIVDKLNELDEFRMLRSLTIFSALSVNRLLSLKNTMSFQTLYYGQHILYDEASLYIILDGCVEGTDGTKYGPRGTIGDFTTKASNVVVSLTAITREAKVAIVSRKALQEQISQQLQSSSSDDILYKSQNIELNLAQSIKNESSLDSKQRLESKNMIESINSNSNNNSSNNSSNNNNNSSNTINNSNNTNSISSNNNSNNTTTMDSKNKVGQRKESISVMKDCQLSDLEIIKMLGKGTFGSVYLAWNTKKSNRIALKCLDKEALVTSSQYHYVKREIVAMQSFHHPFISSYHGLLLSPKKVIFMMEYIPGGELWSYIYHRKTMASDNNNSDNAINTMSDRMIRFGLPVSQTALYSSIILLAIEHIHSLGYCYRDLKPENILITSTGYLKLIDFGFAKAVPFLNKNERIQYRTFTLCGTAEYMSPELVLTQGHDKSVDCWAFGILLFEMLCGYTPFGARNQQRVFEKIVHSPKYLTFPSGFDPHAKLLIRQLLHPNPALRLGALQNGFDDVKKQAFYITKNINFEKILLQEVVMPYIPDISSSMEGLYPDEDHMKDSHFNMEEEINTVVENDYSEYFQNLIPNEG